MSTLKKMRKKSLEEKEGKLIALGLIVKTYLDFYLKKVIVKRIAESGDDDMNANHVFASYMYRMALDEMMKSKKVNNTLQRLCFLDGYDKPAQIDLPEVEKLEGRLLEVITDELIKDFFEQFRAGKEEAARKQLEDVLAKTEAFYGEEFEVTTDEGEFNEAYKD